MNDVARFDQRRESAHVDLMIGVALVAAAACLCIVPTLLAAFADRQPWPRQVSLLLAAHHSQLASGLIGQSMIEATIIEVSGTDRPTCVVLQTRANAREGLRLSETAGPQDLRLLRYWQAEAIPVLLIQDLSDVVSVRGPCGMVEARPALVR